MMTTKHRFHGFDVLEQRPSRKNLFRIFKNGTYLHTSYSWKDAKRMIEFCVANEVWK